MPSLLELQTRFRRALLGEDESGLDALIDGEGLSAAARMAIHRNNMFASLQQVLKDVFPVVCRIVDERFFLYAADQFIRAQPPRQACLATFGAEFPGFLATFPPCRELVYLPDVARLEWHLHLAAEAPDAEPLEAAALSGLSERELPALMFKLHPSVAYLASNWPVDRIWQVNRPDGDGEAIVDLTLGGAALEIRRDGDQIVYRAMPVGDFEFRVALRNGKNLETAIDLVLVRDADFDPAEAVSALFRDGVVTGFRLGDSG